ERLIVQYNKTETAYPQDCTLKELFEEQVKKHPNQVALEYGERRMTYQELDRKANELAHLLQVKGVKAD
ncbi:AMP-binding protein, partial [Bacillus pseudomycoides]